MNKSATLEDYLSELSFHLITVCKAKRSSIIAELRSHIIDKAQSFGKLNEENIVKAINELGSAREIAGKYKEIYGYSALWLGAFAIFSAFISVLTMPVLELISVIVLPLAFVYIIYVSLTAGAKSGLFIGTVCSVTRIVALGALLKLYTTVYTIQSTGTLAGFLLVSVVMIVLGYLPGYYKQKYKKKIEEGII